MNDDIDQETVNVCSALSFVLIFVVVGIPLWWTTTEVYRASLPYSAISQLRSNLYVLHVKVRLLWVDDIQVDVGRTVDAALRAFHQHHSNSSLMKVMVSYESRIVDGPELQRLSSVLVGDPSKTDLSRLRCGGVDSATITIYLLPVKEEHRVALPFISCEYGCSFVSARSKDLVVKDILAIVNTRINPDVINAIVRKNMRSIVDVSPSVKPVMSNAGQRAHVESVPVIKPEYQLEIYFVNPKPTPDDVIRSESPDLRILRKFVHQLSNVTKINVRSQVLYYVDLPFPSTWRNDSFYYSSTQLPHLINSLESFMGTFVSSNPVIYIVLFIPPMFNRPLYILDHGGKRAEYNSFVVAGWGGVVVDNEAFSSEFAPFVSTAAQASMIAIVRNYFGLNLPKTDLAIKRDSIQPLCEWEVQKLLYHVCAENTMSSVVTVTSLVSLLEQIPNIVINDAVGENIRVAVTSLEGVLSALDSYDIKRAASLSRTAFLNSETAFFDPSLLALLYFPDDQKYAIYVPLFLPVCLPVFLSVFRILAYLKKKSQTKQKLKQI